eukprot:15431605-Alexandrium_andersonii.AAC.1
MLPEQRTLHDFGGASCGSGSRSPLKPPVSELECPPGLIEWGNSERRTPTGGGRCRDDQIRGVSGYRVG